MMSNDIYEGLLQRILGLAKPSPSERARAIDGALERARQEAGDIKPTTGPFTPTGSSAEELAASPIGQAAQRKRQADQTAAIQNIRQGERAADQPDVPDVFRNPRLDPRFNKPRYAIRPGETVEQAIRRIQAERNRVAELPDSLQGLTKPPSSIKQGIDDAVKQGDDLPTIDRLGRQEPTGDLSDTSKIPVGGKTEPSLDPDTIGKPVAVEPITAPKPGLMQRMDISPLEASLYLHGGIGTGAYIANKRSNREEPAEPKPAASTSTTNKPADKPADKTADDDFDKEMNKLREALRKVRYNG